MTAHDDDQGAGLYDQPELDEAWPIGRALTVAGCFGVALWIVFWAAWR